MMRMTRRRFSKVVTGRKRKEIEIEIEIIVVISIHFHLIDLAVDDMVVENRRRRRRWARMASLCVMR